MTCREVRRFIYPFLDNELTASETLEIQEHLERCPLCRAKCEVERKIRALSRKGREEEAPPHLWPAILGRLQAAPERLSLRRRWALLTPTWRLAAALVAALLLVLAGLPLLNLSPPDQATALAQAIIGDHDRFAIQPVSLQRISPGTGAAATWFAGKLPYADRIRLPDPAELASTLLGVRLCLIEGTEGANLVFEQRGHRISYYVLGGLLVDLTRLPFRRIGGKEYYLFEKEQYRVVLWWEDDLLCALVSDMAGEELVQLAPLFHHAMRV